MTWREVVGAVLATTGTALIAVAGLGLLRLPDTYNRINAVTKAATLGVVGVLLGVMIIKPSVTAVGLLTPAIILQLLTTPFGSYAVGRAAHRSSSPLAPITHHDELHRPVPAYRTAPSHDQHGPGASAASIR
ncbi:MAG: monovalent cation/H(+) antiporter subunit G [Micromonosporaceae bacterium]|nr:monovalent cation/H(+) antiporter subunit G [Micromonosporaceae bacterium]